MTSLTGLSPNNPRDYVGPNVALNTVVTRNRAPTGADYRQPETGKLYPFNTYWLVGKNPTTGVQGDLWYLSKIAGNVAFWLQLSTGSSGPLLNVTVPNGVSPIVPDGLGTMNFTSSAGTVVITGSSASPNNHTINFDLSGGGIAIDTITVQAATGPGLTTVTPDVNGNVTVNGNAVVQHGVPVETRSRALNAYNVETQYAASNAGALASKSGLAHFDSTAFTVDPNTGYVSLIGGGGAPIQSVNVDANTAPGTDPIVPNGSGVITVTGAQVATGTVGTNVIRSNSLAANTYTMEVQRSTMAATPGALTNNGVSHFDSQDFAVSALGFVTLPTLNIPYTPELSFNGGTTGITYTLRGGSYIRLGNLVFFNLSILLSNKGVSVGDAQITVPFANIVGARAVVDVVNAPLPGGNTYVVASIESGTNYIKIGSYPNLANLANTDFTNTTRVDCSGFFFLN